MFNVFKQPGLLKPWERHRVTVCLPHLETPELLQLAVEMWQFQDEAPFILIIDTGSQDPEALDRLTALNGAPSVEVARLAIETEVQHQSDRVAMAMDYAFTRCPTEYLLASHTDLFPRHRGVLQKLLELCSAETPVVGWEMSPRGPGPQGVISGTLSDGIPGHACTIYHMPTMDRIGAGWSIRRAHHTFGLERGHTSVAGWPDTEVCLGRILAAQGIKPHFLGRETNHETQETDDWVHARSSTVVSVLKGGLLDRQTLAIAAAQELLAEWKASTGLSDSSTDTTGPRPSSSSMDGSPVLPGWPLCHSLRQIGDEQERLVCLHPHVFVERQIVSREICRMCDYRTQPAPEAFRPMPRVAQRRWQPKTVAVIIPCHNYGRFLAEAIDSVLAQTLPANEIIVVDDSSTDDTAVVAAAYRTRNVRYLRVDHRHSQRTRQAGFLATTSDVVCFLDADDRLEPRYLEEGLVRFNDYRVGIVYSDVTYFGNETGRSHVSSTFERGRLAQHNYLHSGSLVLREALILSGGLEARTDDRFVLQDWLLWRRLNDQGWQARKQPALYGYRKHSGSMTAEWRARGKSCPSYFDEAGLMAETVTLFIPLAGRRELWPPMAAFLDRQSWPHDQVRLVLFDTSQDDAFTQSVREWIQDCDYSDLRHVRQGVGEPGLADLPRAEFGKAVTQAMARIYNRLARETTTDYVWVLEDDVFPPDDVCNRLLRGFDRDIASVSATYWSRFSNAWVAWHSDQRMIRERGDGLQNVGGNGFGCVILRGDALRNAVFTATIDSPAYDNAFYIRLSKSGLKAMIDWSVLCEHRSARTTEVPV